ncbi:hypothetical protein AMATHDRAFT_169464 [Amanita thiersii Skay4041]|uniref:Uncharacterized protein n=1 Tax=Amanita thiersii Skay4041 TaxID=703135 RepID=A0A2A9P104_9AGAR|nr:hypothetical protein AMATHDRAFT_169464 [Amanita thiersii Skay4041]
MSAAASKLGLEAPETTIALPIDSSSQHEYEVVEQLLNIPSSLPVIAVDLDDVLSQTNRVVANWHNEQYGTNMDLSTFYYYYYWKNPFWGTPAETSKKVKAFYAGDYIYTALPVVGAKEGVQALKDMGYKLIIVTARLEDTADKSWIWVDKYFPGIFDSIVCTGQFKDAHKTGHQVVTRLNKAQICADLKARLLIDDSAENALDCASATPAIPVLLFGDYEWNKRKSSMEDAKDEMAFKRRVEREGNEFWKREEIVVPEGAPLWRVTDWQGVVKWVRNNL